MLKILTCLFIVVIIFSCQKEEVESSSQNQPEEVMCDTLQLCSNISLVNVPDSVLFGDTIKIGLIYTVYSPCGEFGEFEWVGNGFNQEINVMASYDKCKMCPQVPDGGEIEYSFKPLFTGQYLFHFYSETFDTLVPVEVVN